LIYRSRPDRTTRAARAEASQRHHRHRARPTYHQQHGLALEDRLLRVLARAGWNHRFAPVIIQSFETTNLRYLRPRTPLRLVQLVDADDLAADGTITYAAPFDRPYDWVVSGRPGLFRDLVTPAGLAEVATYADGIGPWKYYIQSTRCKVLEPSGTKCADANGDGAVNEADREVIAPTDLIERAHALGLIVHTLDLPQRAFAPAPGRQGQPGERVPALLRARRRRFVLRLCRHRRGGARDVQAEERSRLCALSGA
jgi:glycerophosphoryl diester phosphodiesterase